MEGLSSQRTDKQVALPFGKQAAGIEGGTRRGDGGIPIVHRLLQAGLMRTHTNFAAIVVASVADHGPAVVFARLRNVDLIAAAGTVLDRPQLAACWMECCGLHIAVAD